MDPIISPRLKVVSSLESSEGGMSLDLTYTTISVMG